MTDNFSPPAEKRARSAARVLGIAFFRGTADEAIAQISEYGGYLVAPSGTCFARLDHDEAYRDAVTNADLALPDSGFMVTLAQLMRGQQIPRISGLAYLKRLTADVRFRESAAKGAVLFVVPDETAKSRLLRWAQQSAVPLLDQNCYVAPHYSAPVEDQALRRLIDERRPRHVVIGIGSGPQEKLGHYLRLNCTEHPAIHCIGGALAFLTGDQVAIPDWADRMYLGWLFRLVSQPRVFVPRLWKARLLPWFLIRHGEELPPLREKARARGR